MLKANNLKKAYNDLQVLKGVNLEIQKAEVVSIVGASGAGKTTLLHILGTLDSADSGELEIDGKLVDVRKMKDKELSAFRNSKIGYVFQFHNLLPEFTALENVSMPGLIAGTNMRDVQKQGMELLNRLGLGHRAEHKPGQMSGGEQQRVAIARALINKPGIIFADEPSGNLDSQNAEELHKLFFKLRDDFEQTFIIVTHNQHLSSISDRKIEIKDGVIV